MSKTKTRVETKTIEMSYDNVEAAVITFLYAVKAIPEDWDVVSTDLNIELNDEGFVEFDVEVVRPIRKHLSVVGEDYKGPQEPTQDNEQLILPLEHFERIHVDTDS